MMKAHLKSVWSRPVTIKIEATVDEHDDHKLTEMTMQCEARGGNLELYHMMHHR